MSPKCPRVLKKIEKKIIQVMDYWESNHLAGSIKPFCFLPLPSPPPAHFSP